MPSFFKYLFLVQNVHSHTNTTKKPDIFDLQLIEKHHITILKIDVMDQMS